MIKVSVYVTSRNYGRFLRDCLASVAGQSMSDWELLIFNEGSSDDTLTIAREYEGRYPDKVRLISNESPKGLRACANQAIEMSRAEYIVRLDGDDIFDENALLVLADYLDRNRDVGLVYPNWTYISENGSHLGVERRRKLGSEALVPDLPSHGACTMVRKRVLKQVGGYDEKYDSQDGHELWMKSLARFGVGCVETPLFYYRQHQQSMSRNEERLLASRRTIKRDIVKNASGKIRPRIAAIVPAKNSYHQLPNIVLAEFAGKPLLDYTLAPVIESEIFDVVMVTSDDQNVCDHCNRWPGVISYHREDSDAHGDARVAEVIFRAVTYLEEQDIFPDVVVVLTPHTPLRLMAHVQEAIDTLLIYPVDRVISTYEDQELHFKHGENGMEPLNSGMVDKLKYEREALYVANHAIHVVWREALSPTTMHDGRIGHIVMSRKDGYNVKINDERIIAESLIKAQGLAVATNGAEL